MINDLHQLAQKLGISTSFSAVGRDISEVSDDLIKFFCEEFGFDVSSDEQIQQSLQKAVSEDLKKVVLPIYIRRQGHLSIAISVRKENETDDITLMLKLSHKDEQTALAYQKTFLSEQTVDGHTYVQWRLDIQDNLDIGYYSLCLNLGAKVYETILAVAPKQCYDVGNIQNNKLWGFTIQLYSLKSRRNWGIGDFTDLRDFAKIAAGVGADIIGINPINTPFHDFPENASPYASISRLFLNPIYIDVEKTEGYTENLKKKYIKQIEALQKSHLIDYTGVYNLKIGILYELFSKQKKPSKAFSAYKKRKGESLNLLALYQAIYHEKCREIWGGWRAWPDGLKNQNPMDIAVFEGAHAHEIEFFKFLQFEAERQFEDVAKYIQTLGMKIGLYRDLPVGVSKDSAELWAEQGVYIKHACAGAPPDAFFTNGQKWGLGAFNPFELKNLAYQPFLDVLRANMKYAGALRMDHVMGLMRLFLMKDDAVDGTYIYYNFEDMLALVALESHLNKCVIVGESIGNVPEGFLETLQENNIYAMSVLFGERWDNGYGDFKAPNWYPKNAFVSVATHDMPPIKMWWFGYEIELKYQLRMIDGNERIRLYKERENERYKLLKVLDENGVWPQDNLRKNNYLYGESYPEGLTEAVHRFVAKSASKAIVVQLEDILGVSELQNLPGTDRDKYPNWRHKLPVDLEDLILDMNFIRNIKAIRAER